MLLSQGIRLEVVKLPDVKKGFVLLPRRWVVERSFAKDGSLLPSSTRLRAVGRDIGWASSRCLCRLNAQAIYGQGKRI